MKLNTKNVDEAHSLWPVVGNILFQKEENSKIFRQVFLDNGTIFRNSFKNPNSRLIGP